MGFYIYLLIMSLVIPLTMILLGRWFSNRVPKKINYVFGYRTAMSMKNRDTWEFAHRYIGKVWSRAGAVLLLSVIPMLFVAGCDTDTVGYMSAAVTVLQLIVLVGSIFPVERALRRTFDENGKRRVPDEDGRERRSGKQRTRGK